MTAQSCVKEDVYCLSCGRVLFKGSIGEDGDIEIVCHRCKASNHFLRADASPNPNRRNVYCVFCGKALLFKGSIGEGGDIEIVCRRCKASNHFLRASEPQPRAARRPFSPRRDYAPSHPAR